MQTLSYRDPAPGGAVAVSLDGIMVGGLLLQAGSGGGKSTAIRQLLEETHGRVQHLVIDPEGEFASLRERFDYVYAAPHSDEAVATPKTARLLCRRLVELSASAVLDIYELPLKEKREFVRLFLEELMSLPRSLWKPILVVVDEADSFFPQQGESSALEAGIDLNGRGRKRGYRAVFTTRRLSKLHKDVADVQNRMIGQTGLDLDIKRAGDELGFDKEGRAQLPRLEPRTFFVYGPAISRTPILARTGDTLTTQPKPGAIGKVTPPAPAKVRALIAQLADLPKAAEEEAKSLEALRQENAGLKRQLRAAEKGGLVKEKPVADPAAIAAAEQRGELRGRASVLRTLRQAGTHVADIARRLTSLAGDVAEFSDTMAEIVKGGESNSRQARGVVQLDGEKGTGESTKPRTAVGQSSRAPARPIATPAAPAAGLSRPQQRMLNALASLEQLGLAPAPRNVIAAISEQSPRSSGFEKNMSTLRSAGYITYPDSARMALTETGRAIARVDGSVTSLADLHAAWSGIVSRPQWRMCEVLVGVFPDAMERAALAAETGQSVTSSGFEKNLSTLRTLGLISYPNSSEAVATELLMPKELR